MAEIKIDAANYSSNASSMRSHIGTSGYIYDWWFSKKTDGLGFASASNSGFYPLTVTSKKALSYYASQFSCVEINATFYKLPSVSAVKEWYKSTPKNFGFIVKFSKFATTNKKLVDFQEHFETFYDVVKHFKEKLVGILIQLPPTFVLSNKKSKVDGLMPSERVLNVGRITKLVSLSLPIFIEFRYDSWFTEKGVNIVKDAGLSMVFVSHQNMLQPSLTPENVTLKDHVYVRFHGPDQIMYRGNYAHECLQLWSKSAKTLANNTYFMFNNTDSFASAINNTIGIFDKVLLKQYGFLPSAIVDAKNIMMY